jgi:hypothetical protein
MMWVSFSKKSFSFWKGVIPGRRPRALARSAATLGFSAMMRALDMMKGGQVMWESAPYVKIDDVKARK